MTNPNQRPNWNSFQAASITGRAWLGRCFMGLCVLTTLMSVAVLLALLLAIGRQGWPALSVDFLTNPPSSNPEIAGIGPALIGTLWVVVTCALFALPIGIGTAIYLEEFPPKRAWARALHAFVQVNITNLAGVPSIVYGILGLTAFVSMFGLLGDLNDPQFEIGARYFDQFLTEGDRVVLVAVPTRTAAETKAVAGMKATRANGQPVSVQVVAVGSPLPTSADQLAWTLLENAECGRISRQAWYYFRLPIGRGVLAASLTLMLVILPVVVISAQEALRAVPATLREAALGLGATNWQMIRGITLPAAIPGIMTGAILAISRAIGEAAPILVLSGVVYIASGPRNLMDDFSVLPIQIFYWAGLPDDRFHQVAAAGIIVLLSILLSFNAVAIAIRQVTQKPVS